ncbi:hypothetical protein BCR32DRAFT_244339 [Anaeromyces robustus]|uniref:Uncharacterized protein n=1 Tax=Anaeromyces robustus TaxID=1754192 RepID=A0A1Y1X906_9FUNG|nr:hypothetical protein BCR32DRAFT_244339 [Anaeromyces robustus]|eukprot:ORX82222.1 hypothetical protein BCR32DRAFT_244339 [Anaeromyces robustus]
MTKIYYYNANKNNTGETIEEVSGMYPITVDLTYYRYIISVLSVATQELFRWLFWRLLSGLGFGIMSGLVSYSTILSESLNTGIIVCSACQTIITSIFILLHIVWSIISFEAFDKKQTLLILWVFLSHLGASMATSLTYTNDIKFACLYCLLVLFGFLFISGYISFKKFAKLKTE